MLDSVLGIIYLGQMKNATSKQEQLKTMSGCVLESDKGQIMKMWHKKQLLQHVHAVVRGI